MSWEPRNQGDKMLIDKKTGRPKYPNNQDKGFIISGSAGVVIGSTIWMAQYSNNKPLKAAGLLVAATTLFGARAEEIGPEDINLNFNDQTKYLNETLVGSDSNFNDGEI